MDSSILSSAMGKIIEQTGIFNLASSLGEGKILNSKKALKGMGLFRCAISVAPFDLTRL